MGICVPSFSFKGNLMGMRLFGYCFALRGLLLLSCQQGVPVLSADE